MRIVPLHDGPAGEAFADFGTFIDPPPGIGERRFFSDWLGSAQDACRPVLHTNQVPESALPVTLDSLEKHPHAAQAFVPLDVSRYVVTVAPSDREGRPCVDQLRAFLVPGDRGVIYRRGVWHGSARVLDRTGSFAVLMWRGAADDDVFLPIDPVMLALEPLGGAK